MSQSQRYFGMPPVFDPDKGTTIMTPDSEGFGNWIGGHRICHSPAENKFYLFYRKRSPLGKGRGGSCGVAESGDGISFKTVWEATKDQFESQSIEVGSLIQDPQSGKWRLYISYQLLNGMWRVDLIEADTPAEFNVWNHRTVMQPNEFGMNSIKDPAVYIVGGLYYVYCNVLSRSTYDERQDGTRILGASDASVLLTSPDGIYFDNLKFVFEHFERKPGDWGYHRARLNSLIYLPPVYVGFFDGGTSPYDMYEEQCGVAISHDLEKWTRVSTRGPWVSSSYGCVRYVDALVVGDEVVYYYEYARKDGSHEIRMSREKI